MAYLTASRNAGTLVHRDELLMELLSITKLSPSNPVPKYLRRDPGLFFETFEHHKGATAGMAASSSAAAAVVAAEAKVLKVL